jgi:hypothetical protein
LLAIRSTEGDLPTATLGTAELAAKLRGDRSQFGFVEERAEEVVSKRAWNVSQQCMRTGTGVHDPLSPLDHECGVGDSLQKLGVFGE